MRTAHWTRDYLNAKGCLGWGESCQKVVLFLVNFSPVITYPVLEGLHSVMKQIFHKHEFSY